MAELSGGVLQALQMLMAGGADLAQGTGGTNLNAAVQGNIQSQSMLKLLKTLLGPDGTKATFSNTGMNLTIPKETEMFKSMLGSEGSFSPDPSLAPSSSSTINSIDTPKMGGGASFINPFVEGQPGINAVPEISGADLAGLSAKDVSTALGIKQAQDQLKQQSYRDLVDATYKGSVIKREAESAITDKAYKEALIDKARADIENDKPIYKTDQGLMLNAKDYLAYQKLVKEDQTPAMKNYDYAKKNGFTGSFMEFQDASTTTHKKDYDEAVKGGYKGSFQTWMEAMAKAGAINLGDLMKKESELTKLQGEKYFGNPDWTRDLQSHIGSKDIQNRITDVQVPDVGPSATKEQKQSAYRGAVAKERAKVNIEFIEGKIAAGGGEVIETPTMGTDGKTVTWKVKWPTGNVTNVTQAIR